MKKRILAAAMAAVTALSLTACSSQEGGSSAGTDAGGSADKQVKIAYIVKAKSDAFWTTMEKGAYDYAKEKGVKLEFQAPEKETDVEKQVQMMENAIVKNFDAIILSAADSKSLAPSVAKANKAGIPVILVNDTMDADALASENAHVETYVGIDQYEAASLAGTYAAKNIQNGKVCYLEGISGVAAHADRLNGFKDQCASFEIVSSQTAKCDRNEAFNVMQNVLSASPEVNVVWAINAEMGQGAIQAIEQGGFAGKVQVFDFDAAPDDIEAIKAGKLAGSVAQYPDLQAAAAIQACLDVIDGKKLEEHTKTKAALVTKENVEKFEAGEDISAS